MNLVKRLRNKVSLTFLAGGLALGTYDVRAEEYTTTDFKKDTEKMILARMLFGEARNCSREEKIAVAYTAINRANDGKKWNGSTVKEAILVPKQYSCFNENDPNRKKIMNPEKYDKRSFIECLDVATRVLEGAYPDPTKGATHYHTLSSTPSWAKSTKIEKKGRIGDSKHIFYQEK